MSNQAAITLAIIASDLGTKADTLSKPELQKTISDLEATLQILQAPDAKFSMENIEDVSEALTALKAK